MAETITVSYQTNCTVSQTLDSTYNPAASGGGATITHNGYNTDVSANSSSASYPVSKTAVFSKALSGGAATIDLTSLTGTNGASVDFSTLKVQFFKFKNPSTNANSITVTYGASNPYLLGGSGFKWILTPGAEIQGMCYEGSPDVDSTHKTIDLSGTGSQTLQVTLVAG